METNQEIITRKMKKYEELYDSLKEDIPEADWGILDALLELERELTLLEE